MSNGKTEKTFLPRNESEELFRLRNRHRHLGHRLQDPDRWMPRHLMEHPRAKPGDVLQGLRKERAEVRNRMTQLSEMGEFPGPQHIPGPDADLPPLRERVHRHIAFVRELERIQQGAQALGPLTIGPPPPPPEEPDIIQGLGTCSGHMWLMSLYSVEHGDDYTEFMHDEWKHDPYLSVDFGRLDFRTDIKVCDFGGLEHQAALTFDDNGSAPFDGLFTWQAETRLDVPYYLNADEASFQADWFICQQANKTRDPHNWEFFSILGLDESVSDGRNVGSCSKTQELSGTVAVREGDKPAVYLGVSVDIEVEDDGRAGTKWDWGSLVIPRPPQYGYWGIEYSYIRL